MRIQSRWLLQTSTSYYLSALKICIVEIIPRVHCATGKPIAIIAGCIGHSWAARTQGLLDCGLLNCDNLYSLTGEN
jgi:hypothetical protein